MSTSQLVSEFTALLEEELGCRSGKFLYSQAHTLSKGPYYLLGSSPAGCGGPSILAHIENLADNPNSYLDDSASTPAGQSLRDKLKTLFQTIGVNLADVCASNLILERHKTLKKFSSSKFNALAKRYWPLHCKVLGMVDPGIIITFGNGRKKSPFAYLLDVSGEQSQLLDPIPSGHGRMVIKSAIVQIEGKTRGVIGLPHPSRFRIDPSRFQEAVSSLQKQLNG